MKAVHGYSRKSVKRAPEYSAWMDMRGRCTAPSHKAYPAYGGRGITICERWSDFRNFIADMGPRPSTRESLDRINVNGPYSPDNCRWATRDTQNNNRRNTRRLTWRGETLSIAQWQRKLGYGKGVIKTRLRLKWSLERIFTEPVIARRKQTLCKKGHPLTGRNLHVTSQGSRLCRQCFLAYQDAYNRKRQR
jgi:hypothetical protein